jgi:putative glutamine amidotransferase
MARIVVSYSRPEKAEKYKAALGIVGGTGVELADAWSGAPRSTPWREALGGADGLLLTGGPDVEPARYGEALDPAAGVDVLPERDAMEWQLLEAARETKLPVLAICRGHQVAHAFLGGRLWQDLGALGPETRRRHDPDRDHRSLLAHGVVTAVAASPLAELLTGTTPLSVNSLHHQAVREPGRGLRVTARSEDGVVEASEGSDPSWWIWTVQWHPEELLGPDHDPRHRALFERFLRAARGDRDERAVAATATATTATIGGER